MSTSTKDMAASRRKLQEAFDTLIEGAEDLLRSTANYTTEEAASARDGLRRRVHEARDWAHSVESTAADKYHAASQTTGTFVRTHPAKAVGIAVLVGVALACLLQRR